jgi:hypothetical protein
MLNLFEQTKRQEIVCVLVLDNQECSALLRFVQNNEFKEVELMRLSFSEGSVDQIKECISYRINFAQQMNMLVKKRIEDITNIVESKNKTLMKEIRKGVDVGLSTSLQGQRVDVPDIN